MITIERTKKSDLKNIAQIYEQAFGIPTNTEKMKSKFLSLQNNPHYIFISAKEDGICVGFAQVVICEDITETTAPFGTFWSFCVEEKHRGKGIGTKILEFAENECKKLGCAFLALTTSQKRIACQKVCDKLNFRKGIAYTKEF